MELRLRPYASAGVALVGASAIAMAPVAPPLPDIKVTSPSVNLSADIDPFTPWLDVFENAETNLAGLIDDWAEAPFPVLQQVIVNQLGYFSELPDFELIAGQIQANLEAAGGALLGPDLSTLGPVQQLVYGIILDGFPIFGIDPIVPPDLKPLLEPILAFSTTYTSGILLGLVGPVIGPILALAANAGAIVANLTGENPDFEAALETLVDTPARMVNAFLNGGETLDLTPVLQALPIELTLLDSIGITFGGLLSPGGSIFGALDIVALGGGITIPGQGPGAIGSFIDLTQAIARAIGWDGSGNPLEEEDDAPALAPDARLVNDTSIVDGTTTAITVSETPNADVKTGDVTPSVDGAAAVDTAAGSGVGGGTTVEQVKVEDSPPAVLDEETDTTPEKPATKRVNPGAKIAGALKSAGDQLNSAVNDLGKKLTKRPSKKAPAADNEKASAPEKDTSTEKAPAASE